MRKLIDITGQRFGRLTVVKRSYTDNDNFIVWECKCDCGNIHFARAYPLRKGDIKSCGCLNNEMRMDRITTHGLSKLPIYKVWTSMKSRCYRINDKRYLRYGGRGILVCKEWISNAELFVKWANENGYIKGLTIDREDNNGNYSPANCRFVTIAKNNRNSSNTHLKDSDIEKIKLLNANGMMQIDIAPMFKITQQTVSKIVNNKTWKNE